MIYEGFSQLRLFLALPIYFVSALGAVCVIALLMVAMLIDKEPNLVKCLIESTEKGIDKAAKRLAKEL